MIVVKVGGSLYDHPRLGPGLRAFVGSLAPTPVLLVAGGGAVTDVVRRLDAVHRLGEESAHWLALASLTVADELLREWFPDARNICNPEYNTPADPLPPGQIDLLNAFMFCRLDDALPESWSVTSDSIAARAAVVYRAERLVLLKSVDIPAGTAWPEAAAKGWVDPHFPQVVAEARFPIEAINFRRRLDDSAPPSTRVL